MFSGYSQSLQIWPPNFSRLPLSFRDDALIVFQNWNYKNFINFEITNTVMGCCQSTLKGCRSCFQYMRLFMSCQKLKEPEVRYTLVICKFCVVYQFYCLRWPHLCCLRCPQFILERISLPFTRACHLIAISCALIFTSRPI